MRLDRSSDTRKAPQRWNDKLTHSRARSDGGWKWVILGGALVCILLVGAMALVMFVAVERKSEAERRAQVSDNLRQLTPQDYMDPGLIPYTTPSMPDGWVSPPVDYSAIPGVPKTPWNIQDGTSNTFVYPNGSVKSQAPGWLDSGAGPLVQWPQVANGWGHLKGRFVVGGGPPELPPLKIDAEDEFARDCDVRNESVVVGPGGGLANVVVYLTVRPAAIHPDYAQTAKAEVVLRTERCRFEPRVCLLRSSQTLKLVNADPIAHEPHAYLDGQGWSVKLTRDEPQTRRLRPTVGLGLLECDLHRWMRGWILVRDDPYMAVTGRDGAFEIKNLPGGVNLVFEVWHEAAGALSSRLDNGAPAAFPGGARFSFVIPADKTHDLGTIEVPAELLSRRRK